MWIYTNKQMCSGGNLYKLPAYTGNLPYASRKGTPVTAFQREAKKNEI
ncbi:hypothetical protein EZS27_016695 [termite gut metagenome]|uniref:Uncharacterized protein n=1 Tax=termite gut metagenome TaxID=433724 RepID=A0A5J4RNF1_9ZZZZ